MDNMFTVIFKNKFRERKIGLSRAIKVMYNQRFTGPIRKEHITWWKRYWIKPIMLEILYPNKGWITLVKVFRDGKPSIRVITKPSTSGKRELLVYKQLHGKEKDIYELKNRTNKKVQNTRVMSDRNR